MAALESRRCPGELMFVSAKLGHFPLKRSFKKTEMPAAFNAVPTLQAGSEYLFQTAGTATLQKDFSFCRNTNHRPGQTSQQALGWMGHSSTDQAWRGS